MKQNSRFEFLVGEYLKQEGFTTKATPEMTNIGLDMFAWKDGKRYVVNTKTYDDNRPPISSYTMMMLFGVMHYYNCQGAIFIYNGCIKDDVVKLASKLEIRLIYFDPLPFEQSLSQIEFPNVQGKVALKVNISLEGYKNYYGSLEFQRDLMRYFKVFPGFTGRHYPFIGSVGYRSNPLRREGCPSSSREKNFYFSFCLFLHNLQAQSIFILSGREMMNKFHAETGVPMISCGLGGVMHPAHVLLEAGLLPHGAEIPAYIKMIDEIMPAIRAQVEELKAYGDTDKLYSYIKEEIMRFRLRLETGRPHPTYMIEGI